MTAELASTQHIQQRAEVGDLRVCMKLAREPPWASIGIGASRTERRRHGIGFAMARRTCEVLNPLGRRWAIRQQE